MVVANFENISLHEVVECLTVVANDEESRLQDGPESIFGPSTSLMWAIQRIKGQNSSDDNS